MATFIDLRSDTVTRPSEAMRGAIAAADVGDDVLGDDPTVRLLEERVAAMLGKEAGCFVPTGTMANACALRILTRPGDEIICHRESHIYLYEAGGYAALCGCSIRLLDGGRGQFGADQIEPNVRWDDPHEPRTRVVAVENTHNRGGGSVWPAESLEALGAEARRLGLRTHLDGARIWNAHAASGEPLERIAAPFDTVSCCFSKGLGAPAGSMVCASAELIKQARRVRKLFGGAMRQSGLLAAAALFALDRHLPRLAEDHEKAARLAGILSAAPGITAPAPETNLVYFTLGPSLPRAEDACRELRQRGVGLLAEGPRTLRAVCHLDVSSAEVESAGHLIAAWAGATRAHTHHASGAPRGPRP